MCYSCGCGYSCGCAADCSCYDVACCNCSKPCPPTTTTTTTINPDCEPCDEFYDCECIIYNGPNIKCYDLKTGDNLCNILETIIENLPECKTTQPPLDCDFTVKVINLTKYCDIYDFQVNVLSLGLTAGLITITPPVGTDLGPFNLYSNVTGLTTAPFATNITLQQLIAGYNTNSMPVGTTTVRLKSIGVCTNYVDVLVGYLEEFRMYATTITDIFFRNGLYSAFPFYVNWGDGTVDYFPAGCPNSYVHTYATPYTGYITVLSTDLSGIINLYDVTYTGPSVTVTTVELGKLDALKGTDCVQLIITGDVKDLPRSMRVLVAWGKGQTSPITGDVADLPPNLYFINLIGQNTIYGVVADLPRSYASGPYNCQIWGNNNIGGNIADLPTIGFTSCRVGIHGVNTITGDLVDIPSNYTGFSIRGNNTIYGDVANLPSGLISFDLHGLNYVNGNIEDFPSTIQTIYIWGSNTVGGTLENLVALGLTRITLYGLTCTVAWNITTAITDFPILQYADLQSDTTVTGNLSGLPLTIIGFVCRNVANNNFTGLISSLTNKTVLKTFSVWGAASTIGGDIADLPPAITAFQVIQTNGTLNTYTSPHVFATGIYSMSIDTSIAFSGTAASNLLVDLNTSWLTGGIIQLTVTGGVGGLNPAGVTAKNSLTTKGAVVTII